MIFWTLMRDNAFRIGGNYRWRPHGFKCTQYAGPFALGR